MKGYGVMLATLHPSETLIDAATASGFVYVPLDDGLQIVPRGGYQPFLVKAWMPVGATGVIRGAVRNATAIADCQLSLLIIPKAVYLQHWYNPYTPEELQSLMAVSCEPIIATPTTAG